MNTLIIQHLDESDPPQFHVVRLADGKRLGAIEGSINLPASSSSGQPIRFEQSINLTSTRFETPGMYEFSILIDQDQKATVPLRLVQATTEQPTDG